MTKGKKVKQALIRDDIFKSKFPIVFDEIPVVKYLQEEILPGQPFKMFLKDQVMEDISKNANHPIREVISDLTLNRGLKKDIDGWGMIYYPPCMRNENGKFPIKEIVIEDATHGVGARFFINLGGSREILNLSIPSFDVKKQIVLCQNEGFSLDLGIAQTMSVKITNLPYETVSMGKGHRDMNIKKNPEKRCLLIMDGYISLESLNENVQKFIKNKTGFDMGEVQEKLASTIEGLLTNPKDSHSENPKDSHSENPKDSHSEKNISTPSENTPEIL